MKKAIVIASGGIDSTTLLFALREYYEVSAMTFDYGQRLRREIESIKKICEQAQIPHIFVDISDLSWLFGDCSLMATGRPVPEGEYNPSMTPLTSVPNRNMVMLSLASAYAQAHGFQAVAYAPHADDKIYPDCQPSATSWLREAILEATKPNPVELLAPFIRFSKAEIVKMGLDLNVPYHLTWSCYKGGERPCGVCPSCLARMEAFTKNGTKDPVEYMT